MVVLLLKKDQQDGENRHVLEHGAERFGEQAGIVTAMTAEYATISAACATQAA